MDTAVARVPEEVLPRRPGRGPTDDRIVEEEAADGRPVLRLLAHPSVGPTDATAAVGALLAAIGTGRATARVMALAWGRGGFVRVEREPRGAAGQTHHPATGRSWRTGRGNG